MYKFVEEYLGVVASNKLKIFVNAFSRKNFVKTIKSLWTNRLSEFNWSTNVFYKWYLVFGIVANIFILNGFFPFIVIVLSDLYILTKLIKE